MTEPVASAGFLAWMAVNYWKVLSVGVIPLGILIWKVAKYIWNIDKKVDRQDETLERIENKVDRNSVQHQELLTRMTRLETVVEERTGK